VNELLESGRGLDLYTTGEIFGGIEMESHQMFNHRSEGGTDDLKESAPVIGAAVCGHVDELVNHVISAGESKAL
jgi:hypothetical protein